MCVGWGIGCEHYKQTWGNSKSMIVLSVNMHVMAEHALPTRQMGSGGGGIQECVSDCDARLLGLGP